MTGTSLPPALAASLDRILDGVSRRVLKTRAEALSLRYREVAHAHATEAESLAYAVARLPATYAAIRTVLAEAVRRAPGFAPRTLLDLGSGPGTAAWAAADAFPTIETMTLIEHAAAFRRLGADLITDAAPEALRTALWQAGDLEQPDTIRGSFDLVIANFSLAEIAPARLSALAAAAWAATSGKLILVEPGTPTGSARVLDARDQLLRSGGQVLAPCPGNVPCPLPGGDWCHFAVRLPRRRDHRLVKNAALPFEDEKYAYAILSRGAGTPAEARILRPPMASKPAVRAALCTTGGLRDLAVPARDKARHKAARHWRWGDGLENMGGVPDADDATLDRG
jgi:ribosomal protein RSM22 (predicted rRNA methylase)